MKGVVDRIENGIATILVEEKDLEFTVNTAELPDSVREDVWLDIEVEAGEVKSAEVDGEKTLERAEKLQEKMEELRGKSEEGSRHEKKR